MVRCFFLLFAFVLLGVSPVPADTPPLDCSSTSLDEVGRLMLVPDEDGVDPHPAGSFSVIVRTEECVPVANAVVEVLIGGQYEGKTKLCGSAVTTGTTDANGFVAFNISGGGCYKGPDACVIRANGVEIRRFPVVVSPDYAGWDNEGIAGRWSLSVNPIDLAAFVTAYQGGVGPASCHDYSNDGVVDPVDLSIFVATWSGGMRDCSP